jgi:hypothetical protein
MKLFGVLLSLIIALTVGITLVNCSSDSNGGSDAGSCCEGREFWGYVAGTALEFPAKSPVEISLAAISAAQAIAGIATPLTTIKSGADGKYETACFDMSGVAMGLLMLSDDDTFDKTEGTWYPTLSGVVEVKATGEGKTCLPEAPSVFGIKNTFVTTLAGASEALTDIAANGFALVFVLDDQQNPVEGAVLKDATSGDPIAGVVYPNATMDDFSGTTTSASGLIIIPGTGALMVVNAKPEKDGMTWEAGQFGVLGGSCMTRPFVAEAP